jgi:transcriptional regulator with XRE-family HTH domain
MLGTMLRDHTEEAPVVTSGALDDMNRPRLLDDGAPDSAPPGAGRKPRRRGELANFLRARRARLSPEDVGMPPGPRRRTPGLRREELALLAGVGITWYTWLEQGRPINASMQVLDAVARTLRLDPAEREHLYQLAEATPQRSWAASTVVPPAVLDILASFDPCPAVLMNARFDVLESNDGHKAVFRDWHSMPCIHRNLLWCGITEPAAREKFLNYDEEIPYLVARLRANYARYVGDPDWEEDIRRLAELSPEFTELWARHEVAEPEVRTRIFMHPEAGRLTFSVTELEVTSTPGTRILAYTPQDDGTRARLPLIRPQAASQDGEESSLITNGTW